MNPSQLKITLFSVVIYLGISSLALAQSDCTVKLKELEGKYEGECKKGLANGNGSAQGIDQYKGEFKKGVPHGRGVYTWSNGMSYDGEFKNGEKEGKGKMTMGSVNEIDSVLTGFWNKDVYVGKYEDPYKVYDKSSLVTGTRITKAEGDESIIYVTINLKGKNESNANFELREQVGSYSSIQPFGRSTKVHVVRFPFRFVLIYMQETVDIEIFNEGSWNVLIDINK